MKTRVRRHFRKILHPLKFPAIRFMYMYMYATLYTYVYTCMNVHKRVYSIGVIPSCRVGSCSEQSWTKESWSLHHWASCSNTYWEVRCARVHASPLCCSCNDLSLSLSLSLFLSPLFLSLSLHVHLVHIITFLSSFTWVEEAGMLWEFMKAPLILPLLHYPHSPHSPPITKDPCMTAYLFSVVGVSQASDLRENSTGRYMYMYSV